MWPGLWKWFVIGLVPQLTIWLWLTVVIGGIFGIADGAINGRRDGAPGPGPGA